MRHSTLFNKLDAFLAVADAGGFTAAARNLEASKNALSLSVAELEKELGVALFVRTTRQVVLTPAGEQLRHSCAPLVGQLHSALEAVGGFASRPSGTLRLTAPMDFSASVLGPALAAFAERYPQLHIDLLTSNQVLDLVAERIDLSVRLGWPKDSSLKAIKVGEFRQLLVAAPDYLGRAGTPTHPGHLASHEWIALTLLATPLRWRFTSTSGRRSEVRVRSRIATSSPEGVLGLVRGGAGISVVTDFAGAEDLKTGRFQQLMPEWSLPRGGIYLTWPNSRGESANLRAFISFIRDWLLDGAE